MEIRSSDCANGLGHQPLVIQGMPVGVPISVVISVVVSVLVWRFPLSLFGAFVDTSLALSAILVFRVCVLFSSVLGGLLF